MESSQPRTKRAGEDFTASHLGQNEIDAPSDKKPRFDLRNPSALAPDAPEEDAVLDADEIGRRGQKVRRKAINIDGYDSDSDNEGFSARREEKSKREQEKDDANDDDDMFAELENDFGEGTGDGDANNTAHQNKKNVRFLQNEEIEGQVASSTGGKKLHVDLSKGADAVDKEDSESDSEVDEEERAKADEELDDELGAGAKKKHAPLLDAFNMTTEQEEGRFDEQGNYVRRAVDPDAAYDSWLDGVSKKDIRKAKEAAEKRDEERKKKSRMDGEVLSADALSTIITNLERGETILEALARLGKGLQRKPKWQQKKKNSSKKGKEPEDTEMTDENSDESRRRKAIEAVTGAADILMGRDQPEIYDTERELLTRQYKSETGEDWADAAPSGLTEPSQESAIWEYRWSDARDGGDAHGPYESAMMQSWQSAGYFGEGVEFRRVGDTGPWSSTVNFV